MARVSVEHLKKSWSSWYFQYEMLMKNKKTVSAKLGKSVPVQYIYIPVDPETH